MLALFLTILVAAQPSSMAEKINLRWVYVNSDLAWESPPKELKKGYTVADNAKLVILYPQGDYAEISATLFRDRKNGRLSICEACGFVVYRGTWKLNGDGTVTIKSRWVYGGFSRDEQQPPGAETEEHWKLHGRSKVRAAMLIETTKGKYIPLSNLTNLSFLSTAVNQATEK
jgi:hypothetical protein